MEWLILTLFFLFPVGWAWLWYQIGRYGLPFELRRRNRRDRRAGLRLVDDSDPDVEIVRAG